MATVKLDISAATRQAGSDRSSQQVSADKGLFDDVYSAALKSKRQTAASDERRTSSEEAYHIRKKSDNANTAKASTTAKTEQKLENEQDSITENEENKNTLAEDGAPILPAWLLLQVNQRTGENTESENADMSATRLPVPEFEITAESAASIDQAYSSELTSADFQADTAAAEAEIESVENISAVNISTDNLISEEVQLVEAAAAETDAAIAAITMTDAEDNTTDNASDIKLTGADLSTDNKTTAPKAEPPINAGIAAVDIADSEILTQSTSVTAEAETEMIDQTVVHNARLNRPEQSDKAKAETVDAVEDLVSETDIKSVSISSKSLNENSSDSDTGSQPDNKSNANQDAIFASAHRNQEPQQAANQVETSPAEVFSAEVEVSDAGQLGKQVIERIDLRQLEQTQQMTIRLRPDDFGRMEIRLTRSPEGLLAQLICDNAATRELLAQQVNDLQQALRAQGFDIVQTEVLSDFSDQQQDQSFAAWQEMQENRENNSRTGARNFLSPLQIAEQEIEQLANPRLSTGSVDYFA